MRPEANPEHYHGWWYCDNIITSVHLGQVGLLHMEDPMVFILVRNDLDLFCSFEQFRDGIAEINFIHPEDRKTADTEAILIDAWNFMALQEREDERRAGEIDYDDLYM